LEQQSISAAASITGDGGIDSMDGGEDAGSPSSSDGRAPSPRRMRTTAGQQSDDDSDGGEGEDAAQQDVLGTTGMAAAGGAAEEASKKKTNWVHTTRMSAYRLVLRNNPFIAQHAESPQAWQAIADELHECTKGYTERNKRGKVVDCRVYSNGTSIYMFIRRRLDDLRKSGDKDGPNKVSGHAGDQEAAANDVKEFDELKAIQRLQNAATAIADAKKKNSEQKKHLKDDAIPDAIFKQAAESAEMERSLFQELQKRKRKLDLEAKVLEQAGKKLQFTELQQRDMDKLHELTQKRKAEGKDDDKSPSDSGTSGRRGSVHKNFEAVAAAMHKLTQVIAADADADQRRFAVPSADDIAAKLQRLEADVASGTLRISETEKNQLRMRILAKRYS